MVQVFGWGEAVVLICARLWSQFGVHKLLADINPVAAIKPRALSKLPECAVASSFKNLICHEPS